MYVNGADYTELRAVFDKLAVGADADLLDDLRDMPFGTYGHLGRPLRRPLVFSRGSPGPHRRVTTKMSAKLSESGQPVTDPLSPSGLERFAEVAAGHVGPKRSRGSWLWSLGKNTFMSRRWGLFRLAGRPSAKTHCSVSHPPPSRSQERPS